MNYKPLIREKVEEFFKEHPSYSYGQLIYSTLTALKKHGIKTKSEILNISDEDFYTGLDLALKIEKID